MEGEAQSPRAHGGGGGGEKKGSSEGSALPVANNHPSIAVRPHASATETAAAFPFGKAAAGTDPRAAAVAAAQARALQHHLHNQHQMMQQQHAAAAAAAYHPAMAAALGGGRPPHLAHHAMMMEDINAWRLLMAQQQQQQHHLQQQQAAGQSAASAASEKGPFPQDILAKGKKSNMPNTADFGDLPPDQQTVLQYQELVSKKKEPEDAQNGKGKVDPLEGQAKKALPATTREHLPAEKTKTASSKPKAKHSKTSTSSNRDNRITGSIIEQAALDAAASIAQRGGMINVDTDGLADDITAATAAPLPRNPPPPPPPPQPVIAQHSPAMIHPFMPPPPPTHMSPHLAPTSPRHATTSAAAMISKLTQAAQTASTSLVQAITALQTIGHSLSVLAPSNFALFSSLPQQPLLLHIHLLDFDSIQSGDINDKDTTPAPSIYLPFDPEKDKNKTVAEYTRGIVEDHTIYDYIYKLISTVKRDNAHKEDNRDTRFYYGAGYTSRFRTMSPNLHAPSYIDQGEQRTSITLSILPSSCSEGSDPKNINIAGLSALAPDSLLLHHLQAHSISDPFLNHPSSQKVIQMGIHTKGPNWGVSPSLSLSGPTQRDKIRVWNVCYDSVKQNIVRRVERDKSGEEYDRKILQYIVDVEREGEEARKRKREAQQQIQQKKQMLSPSDGFVPVEAHAKASPPPTNPPQQEQQVKAATMPLPGEGLTTEDPKTDEADNYQKFKKDLSMTPGAIRARKRRAAMKEDKEKQKKIENEEMPRANVSADAPATVAAASNSWKKKQNGSGHNKEAKTSPSPSQLEQQHKRMAEILVNTTTTATAAPLLAGKGYITPRPIPNTTKNTTPPTVNKTATPPTQPKFKSLEVKKAPAALTMQKTSLPATKTTHALPSKGAKRRGRPPKKKNIEGAGLPSNNLLGGSAGEKQEALPAKELLQRQAPQAKNISDSTSVSTTAKKGKGIIKVHSSTNDAALMPLFSSTANIINSAAKDTTNDGGNAKGKTSSTKSIEKVIEKGVESSRKTKKEVNKSKDKPVKESKNSSSVDETVTTKQNQKQQKHLSSEKKVEIKRHDDWNTVYSKLMDMGWTVISGTGLADFFYVHPSFSGRKRKEIVKEGVLATDYMDNENDLKMYCRKHYGWFGELPGGISSGDFDVGLYQGGGAGILIDGSGSSIGDGTRSHGGEEISSMGEGGDVTSSKRSRRSRTRERGDFLVEW